MMAYIYVASSWRNSYQPWVVDLLRKCGHFVYDFRNPGPYPDCLGFSWNEIDTNWLNWTPNEYRIALKNPIARKAYESDFGAIKASDSCLLVLPSGRSASWEFGYAFGIGKKCAIFMPEKCEPELMYSDSPILINEHELRHWAISLGISENQKRK